ncbi:MAG: TetR/AcrR family transcriptional regulator [Tepidibacter sp.]|jgi:AcrR family transcriptional regulator|uniref:TetR/AcrR family transcriptional regulator n=1 Tax=Tepidibacter sp. TaxID=2529387 RepID=UPI0025D756D4|nr:TetR/AcrR family transcriptional regulator [Tepidibacter sp.]MCT4508055.1 TetR/AcrR family transcriptional regulator [Tepidibacter sp.]
MEHNKKNISREYIKKVAKELFYEKGLEKTSVNDIVKKADIAKGTLYIYYKSKNELIDDIFTEVAENIIKNIKKKKALEQVQSEELTEIRYSIEEFQNDITFLKMMKSNLSYEKEFRYKKQIIEFIKEMAKKSTKNNSNIDIFCTDTFAYIIADMVVNTCYNAIVLKNPYAIDEAEMVLKNILKKLIT